MGSRSIAHRLYVMDTEAFDFVLGTDFFAKHSQILSLTSQAPYVLHVDHGDRREFVPLEQSVHQSSYLNVCKKEPSGMMVASKMEVISSFGVSWTKVERSWDAPGKTSAWSCSPVTDSISWTPTAANSKIAATSFTGPLSGWPTEARVR